MSRNRRTGATRTFAASSTPKRPERTFPTPAAALPGARTSDERPAWRVCHMDHDGPWSWERLPAADLPALWAKLRHLESMTISELFNQTDEPGKHYPVNALPSREARERLKALNLDDMTEVSRLRLNGKQRLYGFLVGNVFHILWWDLKHEIWPSFKKHT